MSIDLETDLESKVLIEITGIHHHVFTKLNKTENENTPQTKLEMIHVHSAQC